MEKSVVGLIVKTAVIVLVSVAAIAALTVWIKSPTSPEPTGNGSIKVIMMPLSSAAAELALFSSTQGQLNVVGKTIQKSVNFTLEDITRSTSLTIDNLVAGIYKVGITIPGITVKTVLCGENPQAQVTAGLVSECVAYFFRPGTALAEGIKQPLKPGIEPSMGRCSAEKNCPKDSQCKINTNNGGESKCLCYNQAGKITGACGVVNGGNNQQKHTECTIASKICVVVSGAGVNQCGTPEEPNSSICTGEVGTGFHTECKNKKCIYIPKTGLSQCIVIGGACSVGKTHTECAKNEQCVEIQGPGIDRCAVQKDCEKTDHLECTIKNKCQKVSGAGLDECQNDNGCVQTHKKCTIAGLCLTFPGPVPNPVPPGVKLCKEDKDCPQPAGGGGAPNQIINK